MSLCFFLKKLYICHAIFRYYQRAFCCSLPLTYTQASYLESMKNRQYILLTFNMALPSPEKSFCLAMSYELQSIFHKQSYASSHSRCEGVPDGKSFV